MRSILSDENARTAAPRRKTARGWRSTDGPSNRWMVGIAVAGVAGFGALVAAIRRTDVEGVDHAITARVQAIHDPAFERAMVFASSFGFPPQSRLLPPAYAAVLWILRYRLEAVFQLAAWGAAPLSSVIKRFMQRPRPVGGGDVRISAAPLDGSSFPSGHVLTYVSVYGWIAITAHRLVRPRWPRRLAVAAATVLVAAVGPSRIYLGHHWPSDVAASYLLGASYLALLVVAYRRLRSRGALR